MLTIRLLGAPDITVDGQPLVVDTRKALAVLAYLTAEGSPQPRDRLVDLLWPEIDADPVTQAIDYVSGMTDRFALHLHDELFRPKGLD